MGYLDNLFGASSNAREPGRLIRGKGKFDDVLFLLPGYRLWKFLLRAPACVHVHPVEVLPRARGDDGRQVRHAH